MKKLMLMLALSMAIAPMLTVAAEEAPAAAIAKPKKKLSLKWPPYAQVAQAKAEAAKNEVPILVLVIVDGDEKSQLVKKYLLNNKLFKKFATENFTTLLLKGKRAAKGKDIDLAAFKKDREFIEQFIMDNEARGATPDKAEYYPAAFFVNAAGDKKLAHLVKYNPELGFGAWAVDLAAKMEQAGITLNITSELKKLMEDPQPDIKQKPTRGKKR